MSPTALTYRPAPVRCLTSGGRTVLTAMSGRAEITPPLKAATGAFWARRRNCVHEARESPTAGLLRASWRLLYGLVPTAPQTSFILYILFIHKNKTTMKRKDYKKPTMQVVKLQQRAHLLNASMRNTIDGWGDGGEISEKLTF